MASEPHRLDVAVEARGLCRSRARARDAIMRGTVKVDGKTVTKPGFRVTAQMQIAVDDPAGDYVSRAALKLKAGLAASDIDPANKTCLDLGASTGGFSQLLLEQGAARVYAVDVGHSQLDSQIASDARIVQLDKTNATALTTELIPEPIDLLVCDISFVSLEKVLAAPLSLCQSGTDAIILFKPQFEVGREHVGKGGIVSDLGAIETALTSFKTYMENEGWNDKLALPSPIKGADGNVEYLRVFSKT
ncbi:TlyA family RNA methyltransferase [uncultured Maritalea sp.]|jgi:23S rRNA (cytidine1920-2'-O)/16S rRNA (cytidine1409-2'-O)-methyltransferase|uniref:TlyA family RNA methyltransferase n=1 Tax=uncultured Maritalea sp. TaxID=757249 RepID=UPI00261A7918|nr:TlyA family RNA methyltransferase [uncultured Maritalea sp.]